MSNIISTLCTHAKRYPDKPAYFYLEDAQPAHSLTYGELDQQARSIAAYLQMNQLSGKQILLAYPAGFDFIATFMGCLYAGAIAVPVNLPNLDDIDIWSSNLKAIANDAEVSAVFTNHTFFNKLSHFFGSPELRLLTVDVTKINNGLSDSYQKFSAEENTIAYLQYTSGSTSSPKGVVIQHKHLTHSLKFTAKAWSYDKKSVTLSWAPHSHVYGIICGLLVPLYHGSLAIIMPTAAFIRRPLFWLESITKYNVTHSGCPNFGYELCIQSINSEDLSQLNLKSWRVAINGGENIQFDTINQFVKKFSRCGFQLNHFNPAYGMSEVTGAIAVNRYGKNPVVFNLAVENLKEDEVKMNSTHVMQKRFVSSGRLIKGLKAVIVDPDSLQPVKKNKVGEVWLKGPSVTEGYWKKPEINNEIFQTLAGTQDIYLRTGDLGFIHKNELCLTGRLKEIIVINGKKYYPLDLENAIKNALNGFPIATTAAFTVLIKDQEKVVIMQEIQALISNDLLNEIVMNIRRVITERFGISLHDVIIVHSNSLPKTPSGKLQRKLCQRRFSENAFKIIVRYSDIINDSHNIPDNNNNHEVVKDKLKELLTTLLNLEVNKINLTAPLSQYQFDSIKIVQYINQINKVFNIELSPAILFEYENLNSFFNFIIEKIQGQNSPQKTISNIDKKEITEIKNNEDIAVIGINGCFPGAENVDTFWLNQLAGKDCISEIPSERWRWEDYYGDALKEENKTKVKWGGFIDNVSGFDASFFGISPREAELTDPQQRLFLQVAWGAIEDAGYSTEALAKIRTGLFVGVFNNDYAELLQQNKITDAYITTGVTHSILANRVSYLLNLQGPSEAIDTACSSSLVAVHHAIRSIQNGDCDVAIVGGANTLLSPTSYLTASKAGMLSEEGRCKTFDKDANGYVRAEGLIAILLKPLKQALTDGDHIYGIIKGSAVNHGGHVSSLTVPNPNAQAEVIVEAIKRAKISPASISYVETHGTGTSIGDPIEINGLKKSFAQFGDDGIVNSRCGLGSVKTHIGHLESAAGLAGIVKVLLSMQYQQLPGNLHFKHLNPYIQLENSPFYIVNKTQKWERLKDQTDNSIPLRAGVSSFGFGGTNAHVILEEFVSEYEDSIDSFPCLITLSAKSEVALQSRLTDLLSWLTAQTTPPNLSALAFTLNVGRNHYDKRCMMVVDSVDELMDTLRQITQGKHPSNFLINVNKTSFGNLQYIVQELFKSISHDLKQKQISKSDYRDKLLVLGNFYTEGFDIDWKDLHVGSRRRLSLPTYPFAKDHYWIPTQMGNKQESHDFVEMSPRNVHEAIQDDLVKNVSDLLKMPLHQINSKLNLSELGVDSIGFKVLAVQLEKFYGIEFPPTAFFTHNTIDAIQEYLWENYSDKIQSKYALPDCKKMIPIQHENNLSEIDVKNTTNEPIAIVGMQGYLPKSKDLNEFWDHLIAGHDLVAETPAERWVWQNYYGDAKHDSQKTNSKWGGYIDHVDQFDTHFFNISSREANLMDPQQRLFLEIVWKTIEDAGYDPFSLSGKEIGVFAGVEFSEYQTLIHAHKNFHGHVATGTSHALIANRVSYFLNLQGPSEVVDTACSSSMVAIHRAITAIRNGECESAIAGGVSLMLNPETFVITSQLGALSPDGQCKTFDKSANGYVKGEGVVAVFLKPLSAAKRDGDHIYGTIKASVVNHGGKAQSLTAPNAETQKQLLLKAYQQANIDLGTVSYIETHGTGTELGDPIEIEGLKGAFNTLLKDKKSSHGFCGLGSVKTSIGHLEPASGVTGIVKVLLAMQHGQLPGNLHFEELNPYIKLDNSPFYIVNKNQEWARLHNASHEEIPRRAGVSSFGFGGTCAHVVLEEAILTERKSIHHKPSYLFTLSTKVASNLIQKIKDLKQWLNSHSDVDLESLSYTLNTGRAHFEYRCAIVADSFQELMNALELASAGQDQNNVLFSQTQHNLNQAVSDEIYHLSVEPEQYRKKLLSIAQLYTQNIAINWTEIHKNENHQRIAGLPTYPFVKQRYWFDMGSSSPIATSVELQQDTTDIQTMTHQYLKKIFADKLQINPEQIDIDTTYEVYGVDSLIGLEITNRLEEDFGTLPKTLLYERNHIRDLTNYIHKKFKDKLPTLLKAKPLIEMTVNADSTFSTVQTAVDNLGNDLASRKEDIAIIGLNGIFPMAKNMNEFWHNLVEGRDCISEVPTERWNYKDYPVQVGGEEKYFKHGGFINDVDKFDPLFFGIAPRDANLMDPQERLFLQTAWSTFEDAGYNREKIKTLTNNEVGVFAGVTYNFYPLFIAEEWAKNNRIPLDIQQFSIANRFSYFMNFSGPSFVVDTACSSSLAAIHLACESLHNGECKMALAGGVNLTLHPSKYHFLGSYSFMSDQGRCASFAEGGAGYVPSEGVGAVLLKPLSLAIRDGDRIYGVIKGSSMNHGGKTSGYTVPNPNAQASVIKNAILKSNLDPRHISYIEAHGTGTALGDPIEIRGLQEAFEEFTQDKQFCAIGSVKSNIGHLESAAGISQLAKVLLQMQYQKLVPSIHSEKLNPFIDFSETPFYVQQNLQEWVPEGDQIRRAGISSFGAGGANIHLIVEEYIPSTLPAVTKVHQPFIFVLSALNNERLQEYVQNFRDCIDEEKQRKTPDEMEGWLAQMCYTLQVGRECMPARLGIIAKDTKELLEKLDIFLGKSLNSDDLIWSNPAATFATLPETELNELMRNKILNKLVEHWVNGTKIDWNKWYEKTKPQMISLPTYPFAKRRCWVAKLPVSNSSNQPDANLIQSHEKTIFQSAEWLIFSDKELGFMLKDQFENESVLYCFPGPDYLQHDKQVFYINSDLYDDYYKLLLHTYEQHNLKGIIYLWSLEDNTDEPSQKLNYLLHALTQHKTQSKLELIVVSRAIMSLTKEHIESLFKEFSLEKVGIRVQLIDLGSEKNLRNETQQILQKITQPEVILHHVNQENIVSKINPPDKDYITNLIVNKLSKLLELEVTEIDLDVPFQNYGMDSIIGINFVAEINEHFPDTLSPMDLYRYPSANLLVAHLMYGDESNENVNLNSKQSDKIDSEEKFLENISHLSEDEINKLLEDELMDLDELI